MLIFWTLPDSGFQHFISMPSSLTRGVMLKELCRLMASDGAGISKPFVMVNHWMVGSSWPWKPPTRQVNSWDVPDNKTWSLGDRDNTRRNYRILTFIRDNKIKPRVNSLILSTIKFLLPDSTWTLPNKTPPRLSRISISTAVSSLWRLTWTWWRWWWSYQTVKPFTFPPTQVSKSLPWQVQVPKSIFCTVVMFRRQVSWSNWKGKINKSTKHVLEILLWC